jgi:hypothetical protein
MNRLPFVALVAFGCGQAEAPAGPPPVNPTAGGGTTTINLSRDAGTAAAEQTTGGQGREYGVGDYAVILTAANPPPRLCWYTQVTTRICDGSPPTRQTSTDDRCVEGGQDCLAHQPEDRETDTGSCWTRIDHETVGGGALIGDCATLAAYHRNYLAGACMFHRHCPGGKCVDYQCTGAGYHLPGAPGPGPGASPDGGAPDSMLPLPMRGGASPDALPSSTPPDASPVTPQPAPLPTPPDASPPAPPPGGPGGPAPPIGR